MSAPSILLVQGQIQSEDLFSCLSEHYDVFVVSSFQEALYLYEKHCFKLRVVLLDLSLSDLQASDVIRKMRQLSASPRILPCSTQHDLHLAVSMMKEGAFDYLVLPAPCEFILDSVHRALSYVEADVEFGPNISAFIEPLNLSSSVPVDLDYSKMKVLIVEDEGIYRRMLCGFLSAYTVFEADSCAQARSLAMQHSDIDVILCDMLLGDGSGDYLVPQLKKILPDVEIIVITAYEQLDKAVSVLRHGASDYLNKPLLKAQLLESLHRAYDRKYLRTVLPVSHREYAEHRLSESEKIDFLNRISVDRQRKGDKLLMGDVYFFFPEFRRLSIPDGFPLPARVYQDVSGFILDLKSRIPSAVEH